MKKFTAALVLCLASTAGIAAHHDEKTDTENTGSFQEHKAKLLKRMDGHLERMNQTRACVEAAADKEALKSCHPMKNAYKNKKEHRDQIQGDNQ